MATVLGIGMICAVSIVVLFSYRARYDRMLGEYDDLINLLSFIRDKILNCSMKLSVILSQNIELKYLSKLKFIDIARRKNLFGAYCEIEDKLSIDSSDKELLRGYFLNIGSDLYQIEMNRLTAVIDKLSNKREYLHTQCPEKKKVGSTLIVCSALLIIIFII